MKKVAHILFTILATVTASAGAKVELLAGSDFSGLVDGIGERTMFNRPTAISVSSSRRHVWVWDSGNNTWRVIRLPSREVDRVATGWTAKVNDVTGDSAYSSDSRLIVSGPGSLYDPKPARVGYIDGDVWQAAFAGPLGLAVRNGDIIIADAGNHRIRKLSKGIVTTLAGSGNPSTVDGDGIFSSFNSPVAVEVNSLGTIFVQQADGKFRTIHANGKVSTVSVRFSNPQMTIDEFDNLYVIQGNSVVQIGPTFEERIAISAGRSIGDLVSDKNGNIYTTDPDGNKIYRITLESFGEVKLSPVSVQVYAEITVRGTPGQLYRIESADSVESSWSPLAFVKLQSDSGAWREQAQVNRRFYRAVLLP